MNDNVLETDSNLFWKINNKVVPGRPSLMKNMENKSHCNNLVKLYKNFQESVEDAWDINDDSIELDGNYKPIDPTVTLKSCSIDKKETFSEGQQNTIAKKLSSTNASNLYYLDKNSKPCKIFVNQPMVHYSTTNINSENSSPVSSKSAKVDIKLLKFQKLFKNPPINLSDVRQLSWSGVPSEIRPYVWRLLCGYIPVNLDRRCESLDRKRSHYFNLIKQYYDLKETDDLFKNTYRQIHIDIPRMTKSSNLFKQRIVQEIFERILFTWAIQHPASGYVQGINDLVTPFFIVFLQDQLVSNENIDSCDVTSIPEHHRNIIEADTFWCLTKFLENIQDNYVFSHLGIERNINHLKELIQRIDSQLHKHLEFNEIDYLQFSFRWMNNLLTRELPLKCIIRLWDTYLAEDNYVSLHRYVCVAFLRHWRRHILDQKDFQGLLLLLQNLPTGNWTEKEIGVLVAEAFKLKYSFDDAPNHLTVNS